MEAVFVDRMEAVVALVETALVEEDPWQGLVGYLTSVCELQSGDRGLNDLAARGFAGPPGVDGLHRVARRRMAELLDRAKEVGTLRRDFVNPYLTGCESLNQVTGWQYLTGDTNLQHNTDVDEYAERGLY